MEIDPWSLLRYIDQQAEALAKGEYRIVPRVELSISKDDLTGMEALVPGISFTLWRFFNAVRRLEVHHETDFLTEGERETQSLAASMALSRRTGRWS